MSHRILAAVAAVVVLLGTGRVSAAEPFRDTAHKYALDLPDGWEVMPPQDFAAMNTTVRQRDPDDPFLLLTAFRPTGMTGFPVRGKNVLVVVSTLPTDKPDKPFPEFEKEITQIFTRRGHRGQSELRVPLAFDERRKRVTVQTTLLGKFEYDAAFLGKDELIILQCLCEERILKDHLPTFEKLADSFRFEDPNAPPPPPAPPSLLDRTLGPIGATAQMAVVGGVVGVLVLVIGVFMMKRSPDRREPRF